MAKTRILLSDDHAILRTGLKLLIQTQPDMEVVGETGSHADAIDQAKALQPDVITLDYSMPDGNANETIRRILATVPHSKIVVLTMHDDPSYFRLAMAAGAHGYVIKKSADSELLQAIRAVAKGQTYAHAELKLAQHGLQSQSQSSRLDTLSDREREVLQMVAQGHTNQAIADKLDLSVKTIESYRARMMSKLGLRSRAELTQFAVDAGFLKNANQ